MRGLQTHHPGHQFMMSGIQPQPISVGITGTLVSSETVVTVQLRQH